MNIYIDESGTVNNHNKHFPYFVIALVHVKDKKKLDRAFKRFVAKNYSRLQDLDQPKYDGNGNIIKPGEKMFENGKFKELKGSQFDAQMKRDFIHYISRLDCFEVFIIEICNARLTDKFCSNSARVFNYPLRLALGRFISTSMLPNEECNLQLDERNERTETRHFLEEYLNTELVMNCSCNGPFTVRYFDSASNRMIQVADIYANWYYSQLLTGAYQDILNEQLETGVIKEIFRFPL